MSKYYTNEKAKFGGTTGTILPFTIQLPTTNFPNFGDWDLYLPAGYLRCNGGIYRASLFPQLASVIGVGDNCPFAKTQLTDEFFQLPDLGSKYVRPSTSSGEYFDDTVTTSETGLKRVGAQTSVDTLVGDTVTLNYSGTFEIEQRFNIDFLGNPFFLADDNDGYTQNDILSEDNFQAHGHDAEVGVFTYLGNWQDSGFVDTGERGDNDGITEGSNELVPVDAPDGAVNSPTHKHTILLPSSTELRNGTTFSFGYGSQQIDPTGLSTSVTLTTNNVQKLDKAVSPYIFVEYIIKI